MGLYCFQAAHDDFDAFAADAPRFDLDIRQLDRGTFASRMAVAVGPRVQLSWAAFARALELHGSTPAGMRTFAIPGDDALRYTWRGRLGRGRDMLIYPRGAGIDMFMRAGWSGFAISIDDAYLDVVLGQVGVDASAIDGECHVRLPRGALDVVRQLCTLILHQPPGVDVEATLEEELPRALIRVVAGTTSKPVPQDSARAELVRRACDFMQTHAAEAPSISTVHTALGSSERTLRRAFHEHVGVSPKAYLNAHRLNGVRADLRRSRGRNGRVSDVAGRWGFWHMGQFAADYRRLFGELPSQTTPS